MAEMIFYQYLYYPWPRWYSINTYSTGTHGWDDILSIPILPLPMAEMIFYQYLYYPWPRWYSINTYTTHGRDDILSIPILPVPMAEMIFYQYLYYRYPWLRWYSIIWRKWLVIFNAAGKVSGEHLVPALTPKMNGLWMIILLCSNIPLHLSTFA